MLERGLWGRMGRVGQRGVAWRGVRVGSWRVVKWKHVWRGDVWKVLGLDTHG